MAAAAALSGAFSRNSLSSRASSRRTSSMTPLGQRTGPDQSGLGLSRDELPKLCVVHVVSLGASVGAAGVGDDVGADVPGFYSTGTLLDASMPPRPDGLCGVSKIAGEALGRLYADKFGLEVAALRIGSFEPAPQDQRQLSTWLSPADCLAAFLAAMTAPELSYAVFYAVSHNTRRWWDLADGQALGLDPSDDAEDHTPRSSPSPTKTSGSVPQGGPYTTPAYTLDRQR